MEIQVDALFFQVRENGVAYAIIDDRVQDPSFKSRRGTRGRLTVPVGHDCWALSAQFLHCHSRCRKQQSEPGAANWGTLDSFNGVMNLWRLHLGVGDLFLSRAWQVSHRLCLVPIVGLSYGMIRHKLLIQYDGIEQSMKDKFWGIGPLFGGASRWDLLWGFSIYSLMGLRLYSGDMYVHQDQAKEIRLYDKYRYIQSYFEGAIGLQWCYRWIYARGGFEVHIFPSVNQLLRYSDSTMVGKVYGNQGDLSLSGFTATLGVQF